MNCRLSLPAVFIGCVLACLPVQAVTFNVTDLGTLGGSRSVAFGINDSGQVVGWAYTASDDSHAFLYSEGAMTDLNTLIDPALGWVLEGAYAINNCGQIAGKGRIGGYQHAFLLTPVPEPSALVLFGSALLAVGSVPLLRRRLCQ